MSAPQIPPDVLRQAEYQARFLSSLDNFSLKKFLSEYTQYMQQYETLSKIDQLNPEYQTLSTELSESYESLQQIISDLNFEIHCTNQKDEFVRAQDETYIRERDEATEREIEIAEKRVRQLKATLREEEKKKQNKLEYDALAEKILEYGNKRQLEAELAEVERLKQEELERGKKLDDESDLRTKQYQLVNHCLAQLEKDLMR